MNSKLIVSALLSLMAVQIIQIEDKPAVIATSQTKTQENENSTTYFAKTTLPVYTNIEVKKNNVGYNELSWTIASSNRTESFLIQRSEDGKSFRTIGRKSPKENITTYSFEDKGINAPVYYRLIDVDLNGKVSYSNSVRLVL